MIRMVFFLLLATALPAGAYGATPLKQPLILTVSLSKHSITIQKNTRRRHKPFTAWIVPIAPGSIRPGLYHIERMKERYRSENGNVYLENVVRTDGGFNLRTSRMFHQWVKSGRPAVHTIVMDPYDGSMLFSLVDQFKYKNVVLRVIR